MRKLAEAQLVAAAILRDRRAQAVGESVAAEPDNGEIALDGEIAPRQCTGCGSHDVDVCCSGATHDDGSHDDWTTCRACCTCKCRWRRRPGADVFE